MPYAADLHVPGALHAAAVRSPYPHARIVAVHAADARRAPGVHAVLTGADLQGALTGRGMRDVPILACDKVRFIGEIVAAVAADTREQATHAAALIGVDYEPLAPVFDPVAALQPGAPVLHDQPWTYQRASRTEADPPNYISGARVQVGGDIDSALQSSAYVFEHTFRTPKVHQGYLEPNCCTVRLNADGTLHVWSCNKSPYSLRAQLAATFDLPLEAIVVHTAAIGGDFGAKGGPLDIPVCVELSRRTRRPVRMLRTYADELTAGSPSPGSVSTLRVGVDADARIRAFHLRTLLNAGAYGGYAASNPARMIGGTPYRLPVADIEVARVYTNEVSNGSMRAPGAMQVVFAVEAMIELVARELQVDPFEFRRRNLLCSGERSVTGDLWSEQRGIAILDLAETTSRAVCLPRPAPHERAGVGVAVYDRPTHAPGPTSLRLKRLADGSFEAEIPVPETGTGSHTVVQRALASALGVTPADVAVRYVDTAQLPFDFGVGGQRVTGTLVNACVQAAHELGDADEVTVETADIPLHAGGVINYCVQVAHVRVDTETGEIHVDDLVSAHDVAEIMDRVSQRGQIEGGVAMGLGFALREDLALFEGQVTASHLGEYKLACTGDMPPLRVALLPGVLASSRSILRRLVKWATSRLRRPSPTPFRTRSECVWIRCR